MPRARWALPSLAALWLASPQICLFCGPGTRELPQRLTPLSEADIACLEQRQLFLRNRTWDWQSAAAGHRCRHGWPQALLTDPLWHGRLGDLVRLTCPLLGSAIDRFEREGALRAYNARAEEDVVWRQQLLRTNEGHRELRRQLLAGREEDVAAVSRRMGSKVVDLIMETGLANMRFDSNSTEVKCLHAQVADELTRGGNIIGRQVLEDLAAAGLEVEGTRECCDHCNVNVPLDDARWTLQSAKNKLGQRLRRRR